MLTNSLKISDTTKKEFLELIFHQSAQKCDKKNAVQISAVFGTL